MKTKYIFILGIIISFFLSACNSKDDLGAMTHFAYQETQNGKWGIMGINGEIVVPPTFQGMPTPVSDGMFFVPRQDDTYELHSMEDPQKIIDANYTKVTNFSEGKAFVVREGENISCIDKNGDILFQLPPNITVAFSFINGLAPIQRDDNLMGYIDSEGKNVIPFQYILGTHFLEEYAVAVFENDRENIYVIDKKGNKITRINGDVQEETQSTIGANISIWNYGIFNGVVPYVANGSDFGLKNINGEIILPASSQYKTISRSWGGYCIYQTEQGCGIMDDSGKILIKDKYSLISSCNINNNKIFIACIDKKWGILSMDEKQLCPFEYDYIIGIFNSSKFVAVRDKKFFLITKTGEIERRFNNINMVLNAVVEK